MKKILVIEDDTFLRNAYRVKLTKSGYTVLLASDGKEGAEMVKSEKPDLILLDLVMPVVDGFTFLEDAKKSGGLPCPVIVASNLGQKEDIDKATMLGAKDFIVKSDISMDALLEKVQRVVGK